MSRKSLADLLSTDQNDPDGPAATDPSLQGKCPMLFDLLTARTFNGKKKRRVCTLSIFAADGAWKASLNERDRGLVLWAAADELASLPEALEAMLEETPVPWRASSFQGRGGKG